MAAKKSITNDDPLSGHILGGTAIKPVERHGWERVRYLLHNPETGEYLTRTPKSWALIFIFYCIYYTCLAGFWYGMLNIFFLTLKEDMPKWTLGESLIGVNPGMGVRPRQADARIDSSMFYFTGTWNGKNVAEDIEEDSDAGFAARMEHFLDRSLSDGQPDAVVCNADELNEFRPEGAAPCRFEKASFGTCGIHPYGYSKDGISPCIIVKLNKIFGLKPTPYEHNDDLPEEIPHNIQTLIQAASEPRRVYIACEGEHAADKEVLGGKIAYFPEHQGIPLGFFPHQNMNNLVSPAIAVQFKNLPRGQLVHVQCKAWFNGVKHDSKERLGLVRFEILIDEKK